MIKEKVTKEDLQKFCVGDTKVFTLPNYNKARSAASYANQQKKATMGTETPMAFRAFIGDPIPDNGQCSVTITRIA